MRWKWRIAVVALIGILAGCGDESPTAVGSELVGEGMRTVQVVYDATAFLQGDTVYDRIGALNDAAFGLVASGFDGELDAHVLFDVQRPSTVAWEDTAGTTSRDTIEAVVAGTVTVVLDTLAPQAGPVQLEVVDLIESFHPATVSWTDRADTAGAEPWTTPGGTTGQVLGTATWESGDTLVIPLDSAGAAVWDDTAAVNWGALRVATPGARLRLRSVSFAFDVRPVDADTVVTAGGIGRSVTVAPGPPAPAAGRLRVGGLPVWRSLLHFLPMDDLSVPCEQGSTTCSVPLSEVEISTANLLLWTEAMGGYRTELDMRLEGRAVLEGPTVPLTRSPLSGPFSQSGEVIDVTAFEAPAAVMTRVPIPGFVRRNSRLDDEENPSLWLALTAVAERSVFGYGEFGGPASGMPPQLEVVVTVPAREVQ
jgi:hypothetical protein